MGCVNSTPADENIGKAAKYAVATVTQPGSAQSTPVQAPISTANGTYGLQDGTGTIDKQSTAQQQTSQKESAAGVLVNKPAPVQLKPPIAGDATKTVAGGLVSLSGFEANTVQSTLERVSTLIQKFSEGRSERTTPIQAIRRALDLIVADAQAKYASVQVLGENNDCALMVALVAAPDNFLENNRLQRLTPQGGLAADVLLATKKDSLVWSSGNGTSPPPQDWVQLVAGSSLCNLSAVPIKVADRIAGILTIGFTEEVAHHAHHDLWVTYLGLISASLASMVRESSMPKYLALVKELYTAVDLDAAIHTIVTRARVILGHTNNHHTWYRLALTGSGNQAATMYDDLTQVPTPLMQRGLTSHNSSSSHRLLREVQAGQGILRTCVAMKSTVMKISVHNRQQVMIPDVQKLINQSGNVSVDIFSTRLIKPPTSVLVFPLKVKHHIFGVMFCMSSVSTDFAEVSPKLRELCEVVSPHLLTILNTTLTNEYGQVQAAVPTVPEGGSLTGLIIAQSRNASFSGRSGGPGDSGLGIALNTGGSFQSNDSFIFTQSRSSTGALVTGLTEKLNQKRIKSSMDFAGSQMLGDLQIISLLGEGGFAKVFKGLWRGLAVGVKVVCDDGKNEKMVMKNAHEIAILGALSHPNIVQAYTCLTDVSVRELLTSSFRAAQPSLLHSQAYRYLQGLEECYCHIEVIEFCDLGNLSTALKYAVFQVPNPDKVLAAAAILGLREANSSRGSNGNVNGNVEAAANYGIDGLAAPAETRSLATANALLSEVRAQAGRVQMRTLLLTLIEIASAMSYLHRMGVVHCDIKPANVLLRSSNIDSRGFTAKVSDFGLSRVEDDEAHSSFPFNSCGTAAYVAPEALICNKKVNSSVDVYAFGILMWEMYTGARPYGNMKQQVLVEEVVMRGLRPRFPANSPPAYVLLAQACWSGSASSRPTFDEALSTLNGMLTSLDEKEQTGSSMATSFPAHIDIMDYMTAQSSLGSRSPSPAPGMNVGTNALAAIQIHNLLNSTGSTPGLYLPVPAAANATADARGQIGAARAAGLATAVGNYNILQSQPQQPVYAALVGTASTGYAPGSHVQANYAPVLNQGSFSYGSGANAVAGGKRVAARTNSVSGDGRLGMAPGSNLSASPLANQKAGGQLGPNVFHSSFPGQIPGLPVTGQAISPPL